MPSGIDIQRAAAADAADIASLVGELLQEIMTAIGSRVFNFALDETMQRLRDFVDREKYFVFVARDGDGNAIAFVALHECYALYAEGAFGTIPELYVRPDWRSRQVGTRLLEQARAFGRARGWTRLEVTTPPLPCFDRTLAFYEREGFAITGGRKLKIAL